MIKIALFSVFFIVPIFCFGQTIISGKIKDSYSNPIPFTNILVKKDSLSIIAHTYSDENGLYSLAIDIDTNDVAFLEFTSLGYQSQKQKINLKGSKKNITINPILNDKSFTLDEVIITSEASIKVKKDTVVFNAERFANGLYE